MKENAEHQPAISSAAVNQVSGPDLREGSAETNRDIHLPRVDRAPRVPQQRAAAKPESAKEVPVVSVLLPVWNEEASLESVLDDLGQQTYADFEVILVDGGSVDQTIKLARSASVPYQLTIVEHGTPTTPGQLNAGLAAARGKYVARVDGHLRLPTCYLETVVGHLDEGHAAVGVRKEAMGASDFGKAVAAIMNSSSGFGGSDYHHEQNTKLVDHVPYAAYSRDLVVRLGGWDERLLANQDAELDRRVAKSGGTLLLDGRISTQWFSKNSPRQLFRQYWRYGRGRAMTVRLHPDALSPRHIALAIAVSSGPIGLLLSIWRWPAISIVPLHPLLALFIATKHWLAAEPGEPKPGLMRLWAAAYISQASWGASFLASLVRPGLLSSAELDRTLARKTAETYG